MNNQSMHPNQSSYNLWTWLIAILLALFLLWKLMSGNGPSSACCAAPVAPVEAAAPIASAPEAFSFSSSCTDFTSNGDAAAYAWVSSPDALKSVLCGGEGLKAEGDGKNVVLTGVVDSDATREKIGADAQAYFGADVTVDNQITVKAAEPVAAMEAPPAAKLYFDTAKTALKEEADASLAPIIAWLNAHPESKAVISGFHDPRGNQKSNEDLAYNRAKAVQAALITAGIDVLRIEFVKPEATDGGGDLAEARRVEVSVK
jgi:outer membrane protein OmpA-like peptidoglycan-associated protein